MAIRPSRKMGGNLSPVASNDAFIYLAAFGNQKYEIKVNLRFIDFISTTVNIEVEYTPNSEESQ
jgi:hypothetical protein